MKSRLKWTKIGEYENVGQILANYVSESIVLVSLWVVWKSILFRKRKEKCRTFTILNKFWALIEGSFF